MPSFRLKFSAATALSLFVALPTFGDPLGSAVTYQGHLKDGGSPANGPYTMEFRLFPVPAGGSPIGPTLTFDGNSLPQVTVTNGLFSVELDFGAASYNGDKRWLDITVSGTPLVPRQELTAAPHARFSAAPWTTSGTDIHYPNGNVGIGTPTPATKLDVNGTARMTGFQLGTSATAGHVLSADTSGVGTWGPVGMDSLPTDVQFTLDGFSSIPGTSQIGSVATGTGPQLVTVSGNYAYVVNGNPTNTLQIFNVSNPLNPTLTGSAATGTNPQSVAVSGSYAYVVNNTANTLQIFNVSNPASPALTGSVATGAGPNSVAALGSYAYVTNGNPTNTLQVFNVSNPASPALTGTAATGVIPRSVAVSGNYAYLINNSSNTLQIFDVSNPASPTLTGTAATGSSPRTLTLSGSYAYVINSASVGLQIFNVSNPASPTLSGSGASTGLSVAVSGNLAYLMTSTFLNVYDVSNPASFIYLGSVVIGGTGASVAISAGRPCVVSTGDNLLRIFGDSSHFLRNLIVDGYVGIGTLGPSQKLSVGGNICATGTIGACSDARFKTNVEPVGEALALVEKLRPVRFDWKRAEFPNHQFSEGRQIGFIAQEVEKVLPQVVSKGLDGYLSVDYGRLTPVIVESIKQMRSEKNEQLSKRDAEIAALKERITTMERLVEQLTEAKYGGAR